MTLAIAQLRQYKPLSLDEFLARYGGDDRYELIDAEVFDLEPTGQHEGVATFITAINLCWDRRNRLSLTITRAAAGGFVAGEGVGRSATHNVRGLYCEGYLGWRVSQHSR